MQLAMVQLRNVELLAPPAKREMIAPPRDAVLLEKVQLVALNVASL